MKVWKKLFNKNHSKFNSISTQNPLEVDIDELIRLRFHASGLDLSASFTRSKKAFSTLSGGHLSPFKGRGLDFDEVRPYQPGDDIRSIDWNVTARTNKVHSKIFKEERERPIFIINDYRKSMHFATRGVLKSVQTAKIAALTAWVASKHHHRIGGLVFTDTEHYELRPKAGHKGVLKLLRLLKENHQLTDSGQLKHLDTHLLFQRLKKIIRPGSLIVFISDFNFIDEDNIQIMQYLARHNDFIAHFIYDPLEVELPPPGQYALTDRNIPSNQNKFTSIDTSETYFRQSYKQKFIQRDTFLEQNFNKMGVHFNRLATNEDVVSNMSQFLGHTLNKAQMRKKA